MSEAQSAKPEYRIGDLVWHRESKNGKVWWPAMVTYDPHLALYHRCTSNKSVQYHVQFFGPSPMRGWVSIKAMQVLTSGAELSLPDKGVSKKVRKEHSIAISEVEEALKVDHKERKLRFIFNFDDSNNKKPPEPQEAVKVVRKKRAREASDDTGPVRTIRKQPKIMDSMRSPNSEGVGVVTSVSSNEQSPPRPLPYQTPVSPTLPLVPLFPLGSPPLIPTQCFPHPQLMLSYPISPTRQSQMFPVDQYYPVVPLIDPSNPVVPLNNRVVPLIDPTNPLTVSYTFPPGLIPMDTRTLTQQTLTPPLLPVIKSPVKATPTDLCPPSSYREGVECASDVSAPSAILTPPCSSSEESTDTEVVERSKVERSKVTNKETRGVCSICDEEGSDLLACTGHCCSMFHLDCLGLVTAPQFKFECDECLMDTGKCFVCGETGELVKCSKAKCPKLYHLKCIVGNKLFVFSDRKKKFVCPLHVCGRCASIGTSDLPTSNLIQCTKCPLALHKSHCLIAGCEVISPTHMVCYQHLKIDSKHQRLYSHINLNTCMDCGKIGSLYCCDVCSAAYHLECLDSEDRPSPEADTWKCPSCAVHDLPTYGALVLCKFGKWRWWPAVVIAPNEVPDNIEARSAGQCMFVVRFCGTRDYTWMHHGRVVPYTGPTDDGRSKSQGKVFKKAILEAEELYQSKREEREQREARLKKPPDSKRYIRIKANKYLVPRPVLKESLIYLPCECSREHPCDDDSSCVNRASHMECDAESCPVGPLCQNQRFLKCQEAKTTPIQTGERGWGLRVDQDLEAGDFVVEYIGEVLDNTMCRERLDRYHENNEVNYYMLTLDAGLVIDASQKSNHARFINHSCSPNCESQKWTVRGETRIGIFACVEIKAGTELTFDYHLDSLGNEKKQCLCGSKNCSGYMGLKSTKVTTSTATDKPKKPLKRRRAKRKERVAKTMEAPDVDTHEDDCFVCGDGGELLLCDFTDCTKAYHLECLQRKVFPPKSHIWKCPRHFCQVCQKDASVYCTGCPMSYCKKHCEGRFGGEGAHLLCVANCIPRQSLQLNSAELANKNFELSTCTPGIKCEDSDVDMATTSSSKSSEDTMSSKAPHEQ